MKKQLVIAMAVAGSSVVYAAGDPVANQFVAGQVAKAADVNANFQELADRIETNNSANTANDGEIATNASGVTSNAAAISSNTAEIEINKTAISALENDTSTNEAGVLKNSDDIATNADDIDTNITSIANNVTEIADIKTKVQNPLGLNINENLSTRRFLDKNPDNLNSCDERNDSFVFNTTEKTFEMSISYSNSTDKKGCYDFEYDWSYDGSLSHDGLSVTYKGDYVATYGTSTYSYEFSSPENLLLGKFNVGQSWGDYYDRDLRVDGGDATAIDPKFSKKTAVGYQNITVPAGSYEDCLVVQNGGWSGGEMNINTLYFYCNVGLARIVDLKNNRDWQLVSQTEQ